MIFAIEVRGPTQYLHAIVLRSLRKKTRNWTMCCSRRMLRASPTIRGRDGVNLYSRIFSGSGRESRRWQSCEKTNEGKRILRCSRSTIGSPVGINWVGV